MLNAVPTTSEVEEEFRTKLYRIDKDSDVETALEKLTAPVLAIDTETTGLDPMVDRLLLVQISDGKNNFVFDMTRIEDWQPIRRFISTNDHLWLAHNEKFDYSWMAWKFADSKGPAWEIMPRAFDTYIAESLITAGLNLKTNLKETAFRYLKINLDKAERATFVGITDPQPVFTDSQLEYAAKDVEILPAIFKIQADKINRLDMQDIAKVEFTLVKVIARMELYGVLIDIEEWNKVVNQATERCAELEKKMVELSGDPKFNPRSPKQLSDAFKKMGFVLASTNAATLKKIQSNPLAEIMLEYRKAVVLRDRYGENWLARLGSDNRVRAQFRQIGAATGRFSSANPNLQQLPRGDLLRKAFIAGPGRKMVTADYSQIEIRILAELSNDTNMIGMFRDGLDIHTATAAQMFQLKLEDVTPQRRQMAKSVNFGLIYGAGADNLRGQLADQGVNVSKPEAEHLIRLYFEAFPKAKLWLDKQSKRAYNSVDEGLEVLTRTLGGRIRRFPVNAGTSGFERGHIARQSRNTPIQGSSADITKEAMNRLDAEFLSHPEWDAHLLMTVHDELVCECKEEYADIVSKTVERCMVEGAQRWLTQCPVKVDYKVADSWSK